MSGRANPTRDERVHSAISDGEACDDDIGIERPTEKTGYSIAGELRFRTLVHKADKRDTQLNYDMK
jgi:hypothetical protein